MPRRPSARGVHTTADEWIHPIPAGREQSITLVSYQVIQVDVVGDLIDFAIDLPLVNPGDPEWEPVVHFHFDLQDIPVFRGQTVALQQTYAHEINGIEIRLKSIQNDALLHRGRGLL